MVAWPSWSMGVNIKCLSLVLIRALLLLLGHLLLSYPFSSLGERMLPPLWIWYKHQWQNTHLLKPVVVFPFAVGMSLPNKGPVSTNLFDRGTFCCSSCDVPRGNIAVTSVYWLKFIVSAHSYVTDWQFIHFVQLFKSLTHPQILHVELLP